MNEAGLAILRPYPCCIVGDWHFKVVYNTFSLEILIPSSPRKIKEIKNKKKFKKKHTCRSTDRHTYILVHILIQSCTISKIWFTFLIKTYKLRTLTTT